jgi:ribonucleoside-diphosphate reductase alpha chain
MGGEHVASAPAPALTLPQAVMDATAMASSLPATNASLKQRDAHEGAPTCSECGMLMVPNGACYKCENCGSTSGCS